jgi:hypothetical protein
MAREPRNYSGDKWRQKDRYDHIITEDAGRAAAPFVPPRAYASVTGLLGCAGVIAVLYVLNAIFGEGFATLLTWLIWALVLFAPLWMAQGIIRFLLPPEWRPPAIPTWVLSLGSLAGVVAWDLTLGLPVLA